MEDEKVLAAAKAAFAEASKDEHGLWFSSLAWDDVEQLHDVFIACTRIVINSYRKAHCQPD